MTSLLRNRTFASVIVSLIGLTASVNAIGQRGLSTVGHEAAIQSIMQMRSKASSNSQDDYSMGDSLPVAKPVFTDQPHFLMAVSSSSVQYQDKIMKLMHIGDEFDGTTLKWSAYTPKKDQFTSKDQGGLYGRNRVFVHRDVSASAWRIGVLGDGTPSQLYWLVYDFVDISKGIKIVKHGQTVGRETSSLIFLPNHHDTSIPGARGFTPCVIDAEGNIFPITFPKMGESELSDDWTINETNLKDLDQVFYVYKLTSSLADIDYRDRYMFNLRDDKKNIFLSAEEFDKDNKMLKMLPLKPDTFDFRKVVFKAEPVDMSAGFSLKRAYAGELPGTATTIMSDSNYESLKSEGKVVPFFVYEKEKTDLNTLEDFDGVLLTARPPVGERGVQVEDAEGHIGLVKDMTDDKKFNSKWDIYQIKGDSCSFLACNHMAHLAHKDIALE